MNTMLGVMECLPAARLVEVFEHWQNLKHYSIPTTFQRFRIIVAIALRE